MKRDKFMTERKPPELPFESWVEQQIRKAQEQGHFDNLSGSGKPIPVDSALDGPNWWIRKKMAAEGLRYPSMADDLRQRVTDMCRRALQARSEREARTIVQEINKEIRAYRVNPPPGVHLTLKLVDIDEILASRRAGGSSR
ncbi:MAG: DUF1992 domain-containing protein [Rhodococcus sp. (in: high G+C Gram-positive bacteria)]|nr:DUF1992 domain-containing protein [Rhodococcus sp. (in: high G+C Gram-positive bacteria)]